MRTTINMSPIYNLLRRHAKTFLTAFACILIAVACILGLVYSAFQSVVLDSVALQHRDFVVNWTPFRGSSPPLSETTGCRYSTPRPS